jgi:hypothetical protein
MITLTVTYLDMLYIKTELKIKALEKAPLPAAIMVTRKRSTLS